MVYINSVCSAGCGVSPVRWEGAVTQCDGRWNERSPYRSKDKHCINAADNTDVFSTSVLSKF